MAEIKVISYEEARLAFFREQREKARRSMDYWCRASSSDRHGYITAWDKSSEAGQVVCFYDDVIRMLEGGAEDGK